MYKAKFSFKLGVKSISLKGKLFKNCIHTADTSTFITENRRCKVPGLTPHFSFIPMFANLEMKAAGWLSFQRVSFQCKAIFPCNMYILYCS